jgi:putative transposase
MSKFREMKTLQKFASIRASIHYHFNIDRQLYRREIFKRDQSTALAQ